MTIQLFDVAGTVKLASTVDSPLRPRRLAGLRWKEAVTCSAIELAINLLAVPLLFGVPRRRFCLQLEYKVHIPRKVAKGFRLLLAASRLATSGRGHAAKFRRFIPESTRLACRRLGSDNTEPTMFDRTEITGPLHSSPFLLPRLDQKPGPKCFSTPRKRRGVIPVGQAGNGRAVRRADVFLSWLMGKELFCHVDAWCYKDVSSAALELPFLTTIPGHSFASVLFFHSFIDLNFILQRSLTTPRSGIPPTT